MPPKLGTAPLVATVVGFGAMAERLAEIVGALIATAVAGRLFPPTASD